MKRFLSFVPLFFLLACGEKQDMATVSGTIELSTNMTPDSVLVGLYKMESRKLGELIDFIATDDGEFTLHAEPGTYTIAAWAFGFENEHVDIYLPEKGSTTKTKIKLAQIVMPEPVDRVRVLGPFNEWNRNKAVDLRKEAGLWKLNDTSNFKTEKVYKFVVNNEAHFYYDMLNPNFRTQRDKMSFESIYNGGDVIFDPSLYATESQPSGIEVYGPFANFNDFTDSLTVFNRTYRMARRAIPRLTPEQVAEQFSTLQEKLSTLDAQFEGTYSDSKIAGLRLQVLINASPMTKKVRDIWSTGERDTTELKTLFQSDAYAAYVKDVESSLEKVDLNSQLLDGDFVRSVTTIDSYAKEALKSLPDLQISPDYFAKILLRLEGQATNSEVGGAILFYVGWEAAYEGNAEFAEPILLNLKNKYPNHWSVVKGTVDNSLTALKMTPGTPAPAFAVETLTGDSLRLQDYRGKFVFLDFWGSWCGPCKIEIPFIKDAYAHFSSEKVQIMGLARDNLKPLTEYIAKEKISYPNALATPDILKAYGISAYPTNFLIAPDGHIIVKNLRGSDLIQQIEEQIGAWEIKNGGSKKDQQDI